MCRLQTAHTIAFAKDNAGTIRPASPAAWNVETHGISNLLHRMFVTAEINPLVVKSSLSNIYGSFIVSR